ncbi:hypothetical protein [Hymenobacter elongatus]|uniref:Uncharacterized protein n=1 Tax=Hymenobacter elongatus TaxID=877208 RepID=A0A4Z0PS91_9BACT|nr:hypothetical protein [Hymenobacter elongatus]TGE20196.1 hypothetical protein E5J99_01105 [Hymenobacter elongatus]
MNALSSLIRPVAAAADTGGPTRLPQFSTVPTSSVHRPGPSTGQPGPKRDYATRQQMANQAARAQLAARSRLVIPSSAKRF